MSTLQNKFIPHSVLVSTLVVVPIVFLSAIPWLKEQPDWLVLTLGGVASLTEVGGAILLMARKDRESDEWHKDAARFGSFWGWIIGAGIVPLLLVLPPFQSLVVTLARASDAEAVITDRAALLIFLMGFVGLVLLQTLCTGLLSLFWRIWMSRAV